MKKLFFLVLVALLAGCQSQQDEVADVIYINGDIYTVNAEQPRVEAIAVKGERIMQVGTTAEIEALKGENTEVVDLEGRFAMPGFIEGHGHFSGLGQRAWHKPTTIRQTGEAVAKLVQTYPGKAVMVLETGYIWTLESNDEANNIINDIEPNYSPASPESQRRFLIDLTQEVIDRGGSGVVYWEPAWVSSPCRTQWGRGSHQENATFFDFDTNLIPDGGIAWMTHNYENLVSATFSKKLPSITITPDSNYRTLEVEIEGDLPDTNWQIEIANMAGQVVATRTWAQGTRTCTVVLPDLPAAVYFVTVQRQRQLIARERIWLHRY